VALLEIHGIKIVSPDSYQSGTVTTTVWWTGRNVWVSRGWRVCQIKRNSYIYRCISIWVPWLLCIYFIWIFVFFIGLWRHYVCLIPLTALLF